MTLTIQGHNFKVKNEDLEQGIVCTPISNEDMDYAQRWWDSFICKIGFSTDDCVIDPEFLDETKYRILFASILTDGELDNGDRVLSTQVISINKDKNEVTFDSTFIERREGEK